MISRLVSRLCSCSASAVLIAFAAFSVEAQQTDTARVPTGAFVGRVINSLDSTSVRSADLRLVFVDSVRQIPTRDGHDSLDVFADSARGRVAATDSTGAFAIRRLAPGRYLLHIRRLGYEQLQGALVVDTGTVRATIALQVVSRILAKVVVTESSVDRVKERLDRFGFIERSRLGIAATFVQRAEILRTKPQTIADLLARYGIHDATIMLDRMEFDYQSVSDYPAELVIGMEIYRHSRPTEFNRTRSGPSILSAGGQAAAARPLVVIWTFIP